MKKIYTILIASSALLYSCGDKAQNEEENNNTSEETSATDTSGTDEELFDNSQESTSSDLGNPSVKLTSDDEKLSYCFGYQTGAQVVGGIQGANNVALRAGFDDFIDGDTKISYDKAFPMVQKYLSSGAAKKDKSKSSESSDLITKKDSMCYAYGIVIGNGVKTNFNWISSDAFFGGFTDKVENKNPEAESKIPEVQQALYGKRMYKEGTAFLEKNGARPEVVTLPSGLQYEILKKGMGPIPTASQKVKVHYHGTLIDGKVFDSSVERGQPATFGVTQVIQGWVEALQLMPVGSKWKLYIPYDLAYGERGSPPKIAPYSALIFEVELLEIVE